MGVQIEPCEWSESSDQNRSKFKLLFAYGFTMASAASTLIRMLMDDMEWGVRRKIRDYFVGMIPKPVRKITGLILIISGVVAILGFWIAALFWLTDYMMICVIGILVGIVSISWGRTLLRHRGL